MENFYFIGVDIETVAFIRFDDPRKFCCHACTAPASGAEAAAILAIQRIGDDLAVSHCLCRPRRCGIENTASVSLAGGTKTIDFQCPAIIQIPAYRTAYDCNANKLSILGTADGKLRLLQMLLLWTAATLLPDLLDNRYVIRMLGMIGVLFIVLMIPEFWKNKSCDCMQIEATCLYSLRQIYAARIFLFGIVDLFMISLFCITLRGSVNLALSEIVIQFLFPAVVTACICFGTLCSNSRVNEGTSIILCLLWSGIWWFIINNETIYVLITLPVWYALFGTAVVFLIGAIYKTIFDCNKFWEVDLSGTTIS